MVGGKRGSIILLVLLLVFYGNIGLSEQERQVKYINFVLNVSNKKSASVQGDTVFFTSQAGRQISGNANIVNQEEEAKTMKLSIESGDELGDWITLSRKQLRLEARERQDVKVTVDIPPDACGVYMARLRIEA